MKPYWPVLFVIIIGLAKSSAFEYQCGQGSQAKNKKCVPIASSSFTEEKKADGILSSQKDSPNILHLTYEKGKQIASVLTNLVIGEKEREFKASSSLPGRSGVPSLEADTIALGERTAKLDESTSAEEVNGIIDAGPGSIPAGLPLGFPAYEEDWKDVEAEGPPQEGAVQDAEGDEMDEETRVETDEAKDENEETTDSQVENPSEREQNEEAEEMEAEERQLDVVEKEGAADAGKDNDGDEVGADSSTAKGEGAKKEINESETDSTHVNEDDDEEEMDEDIFPWPENAQQASADDSDSPSGGDSSSAEAAQSPGQSSMENGEHEEGDHDQDDSKVPLDVPVAVSFSVPAEGIKLPEEEEDAGLAPSSIEEARAAALRGSLRLARLEAGRAQPEIALKSRFLKPPSTVSRLSSRPPSHSSLAPSPSAQRTAFSRASVVLTRIPSHKPPTHLPKRTAKSLPRK